MYYIVLCWVCDFCGGIKYIPTRTIVKSWVYATAIPVQYQALTVPCITNNINHLRAFFVAYSSHECVTQRRGASARGYRLLTNMTKLLQTTAHLMFWGAVAITIVGLAIQYGAKDAREY